MLRGAENPEMREKFFLLQWSALCWQLHLKQVNILKYILNADRNLGNVSQVQTLVDNQEYPSALQRFLEICFDKLKASDLGFGFMDTPSYKMVI